MYTLAKFLRDNREQILEEWQRRASQLPSAHGLSREGQRDHIPELIDAMAAAIDRGDTTTVSLEQLPLVHADHRWTQDYDLREIVAEYRLLRRVILEMFIAAAPDIPDDARPRLPRLITLNENIDHAITDAVDHFALQREHTREYFVGMLSHDLRDPLGTISMTAEVLLRGDRDGHEQQAIRRILRSAGRMRRLIDDMLDVTRGRLGGGLPITPVEADLREVLLETVDEFIAAHPRRSLRIEAAGDPDLRGQWDPMRLAQAVSNLIANAIKHGADPIVISPSADDARITLEVRNAGEVAIELRRHLFEPFQTRDPMAGSGLGLSIASEIARAHGGTLTLVPDTPGETRFRLELPRRTDAAAMHSDRASSG